MGGATAVIRAAKYPETKSRRKKPRIDVVGALATIGLLDHHRNELVLVGIARISHVAFFGHADRRPQPKRRLRNGRQLRRLRKSLAIIDAISC